MKEISVRDLVAAIEFTLNGLATDQITQLLDDISEAQQRIEKGDDKRPNDQNLHRGLKFLSSISIATIETRISS